MKFWKSKQMLRFEPNLCLIGIIKSMQVPISFLWCIAFHVLLSFSDHLFNSFYFNVMTGESISILKQFHLWICDKSNLWLQISLDENLSNTNQIQCNNCQRGNFKRWSKRTHFGNLYTNLSSNRFLIRWSFTSIWL